MYKAIATFAAMALWACGVSFGEEKTKSVEFGKDTKHTMTVPEKWETSTPGGMRALEVKVPKQGDDKDDGEIAVFIFAAGGGVDANIARWSKQMGGGEAKKSEAKTASGKTATMVEIEGTYAGMGKDGQPMAAKEGYKLLGAIVDDDGVFIKLTGPKATIAASKAAFDAMIASYK
ncbi:MAG TPA: hypothetical protein VKX17_01465 [Planctomycetota bacterium]|nr:hypothetical protein [Planctomycetota bacterium]